MTEPAFGTATGTEISERTRDLVLPGVPVPELPISTAAPERKAGLADSTIPSSHSTQASQSSDAETGTQRGIALPGDRGPRTQSAKNQRPSFWRRIALGGLRASEPTREVAPTTAKVETQSATPSKAPSGAALDVEQRIVEPLLQSLVSIEAKLERSHVDLSQRSDQVEQRLTQLWDIEEQLGTLVELQESLTQVSEQQRRLSTAIESQTRTLRWLVGSIFFSLAVAAFVVAAVLR